MNNSNIILRLKKTIIYTEKILSNFPKTEFNLRKRIDNCLYDLLENTYNIYSDIESKNKIIRQNLAKLKMIDFYLKLSFDKEIISYKQLKNLSLNLRDITNLYYVWMTSSNETRK